MLHQANYLYQVNQRLGAIAILTLQYLPQNTPQSSNDKLQDKQKFENVFSTLAAFLDHQLLKHPQTHFKKKPNLFKAHWTFNGDIEYVGFLNFDWRISTLVERWRHWKQAQDQGIRIKLIGEFSESGKQYLELSLATIFTFSLCGDVVSKLLAMPDLEIVQEAKDEINDFKQLLAQLEKGQFFSCKEVQNFHLQV